MKLCVLQDRYWDSRKDIPPMLDLPDPVEAIKFMMEQRNLTVKNLVPCIGQTNRVYEILNRKRPGDTVPVTLYRGGKKMDLQVKLAERTTK